MTNATDGDQPSTDYASFLRAADLRVTPQRLAIIGVLAAEADHPSADEILSRARRIDDTVSLATVYRTLSSLEAAGIIRKLAIEDASARFELTPRREHDHLVDVDTGEVIEIPNDEIVQLHQEIARRMGYDIVSHHTILRGRRRQD
ncbi:Fur family ferric uptake transcriptional regulator [Rhizobium sp. PP-F2F-G20b]|nr:Fur family ferric uptake transcriptional regulator [Rhizobium sp. PP-F2F-G20b]